MKPRIRWSAPHGYWILYYNDKFICVGDTLEELWKEWLDVALGVVFQDIIEERENKRITDPVINLPPNYFDNIWIGAYPVPAHFQDAEEFIDWIHNGE